MSAASFLLCLVARAALPEPGDAGWHRDLDEARAIAARLDKPLMVVFRCVP